MSEIIPSRPLALDRKKLAAFSAPPVDTRPCTGPRIDTKAGFTEVAFAAEACNLFRAASDAGRMPRFPQGRWQRRAVGRHDTSSNRLRFFAGPNHPHRLCADMRMSES